MAPFAIGVFILLLGVFLQVGAPPTPIAGRPPEDIVCHPNGIYGYAEYDAVIVQEKETWFQLDISSPNLHECIRRCYGYRFCYSLTFDHTREKPCIFYLHASDKCPGKDLVNLNEIEYKNKPVNVACLKCGEPKHPESQSGSIKKTDDKPAVEFSEDEHSESVPANGGEQPVISESKDDNIQELIAEPKPSTTTIGYRQSCIVTFQVFMNEDINAFKTTRIATVSTINECAYICYQNSCSGAIYVPSSDGKAQCKVQMREKEKCNSKLQRHYTFTHEKAVVLSCFRCQPDKPITLSPDAEIIRATTTPRPELTKGRLTTIAPEKADGKEEGPVPPPESSNKVEDTPKHAKPPAMAPTESGQVNPESNAAEESETAKPSDSEKSGEKSESDKTEEEKPSDKIEVTSPETPQKSETVKPAESEKAGSTATEKPAETEKSSESQKSESTTPSSPDTSGKTLSLGKVTTGPVDFGGCLITFQADYLSARPSEFKSEFELNLNVESPEICATRCYQDGCTGALYLSNNGTCVLGYGDKHHCNKRPLINFLNLKDAKNGESIWIHCTSCRSGKYGATGSVTGNMNNNKVEMGEQLSDGKSLKAQTTEPTDDATTKTAKAKPTEAPQADATKAAAKTDKSEEKVTEAEKPEVTEKPTDDATKTSGTETTVAAVKEDQTTVEPKAESDKSPEKVTEAEKPTVTEKPAAEATSATSASAADKSEEKPSSSSKAPEKSTEESKPTEAPTKSASGSEKPHKPDDTDGTQGCLITFQAGDLSQRPKEFTSEFELNLHTETPEICATRCYQDGCTGALFFPKNGTCVLGYGDKQYCDKSPILRFYKHSEKETHKESLWIHCTVCRSQRHGETFEPVAEEKLQSTST